MFLGAVNARDQDRAKTVDFGNIKEVFKLDTGAQCNGSPKTVYDKITKTFAVIFGNLVFSQSESVSCLVGCMRKSMKLTLTLLMGITYPSWDEHPASRWGFLSNA